MNNMAVFVHLRSYNARLYNKDCKTKYFYFLVEYVLAYDTIFYCSIPG